MEFKDIPLGHLYRPDTTVPTLTQQTIKVTSLKDIEELSGKPTVEQCIDYTDLEDIDDTIDTDLAKMGFVGAITLELPQLDCNIRTMTPEKLVELKTAGMEGAEWNATYN